MNASIYIKKANNPSQTFFYNDAKIKKIEDDGSTVTDEFSTVDNEEKLRAAKGIIYVTIFCIPFWLLFIMFVGWLV